MSDLIFDCMAAKAEPYAMAPTLVLRLRIVETTGEAIHCLALRCQIRIEPLKRRYSRHRGRAPRSTCSGSAPAGATP